MQCVAVCCSVLQCVAVCCVVLQCVAVSCSVLQCVAVCCSVLQFVAACADSRYSTPSAAPLDAECVESMGDSLCAHRNDYLYSAKYLCI